MAKPQSEAAKAFRALADRYRNAEPTPEPRRARGRRRTRLLAGRKRLMDLHERLTHLDRRRPAGAHDPFAELKNRVHLAVIGDLGPQLFNVSMDPEDAARARARGHPRPARAGDGPLA